MSGPREEKKRMRRPEICGRYISLGTPERLAVEALSPYGVQGGPFFSLFSSQLVSGVFSLFFLGFVK